MQRWVPLFFLIVLMPASVVKLPAEEIKAQQFSDEQIEFFESKVRPLLSQHCFECHSGKAKKLQAGLRLDSRVLAIEGGDSGAAIEPGKPAESLLIESIRWQAYEMPPKGKLKDSEIAVFEKWISDGAAWPDDQTIAEHIHTSGYDWKKWRSKHWSFQPVTLPDPPEVQRETWIQSDLDRFVLARLEAAEISPAPAAEPGELVRRIYFDLIGLPPSPQQVESFLGAWENDSRQAVSSLVEELLASPHYGERWGRHWLDVARYSDGYGGFLDNKANSEAWRYRDWVIQALNDDLPLDEFLKLQIAGDLTGSRDDAVATGFFALGPTYRSDGGDPDSVAQAKAETLSDRLDTLGRGMLGLTLACCRCHDHKFDPLPQQDYYSLAGVFNNTNVVEHPLVDQEIVDRYKQHQQAIQEKTQQINKLNQQIKQEKRELTAEEQQSLDSWNKELEDLKQTAPPKYEFAHSLRDTGSADMQVAIRGNLRKPGEPAPRRFLQVLSEGDPELFLEGSGRRQLAEAVVDEENPLTSRVFVNRVWMHHFGKALVRTPSNFGSLGEQPTHPRLLDWLTATFLEQGQSLKALHRTIMLSSTYQMSSRFDEKAYAIDGDNRLIWRMNLSRLDAESWRDALLSVTGELDMRRGGPPVDRIDNPRRTVYFKVSRNGDVFATDEFLRRFDFPLMRATIDKRPTSIVPQQFLFLLNSQFMTDRARALSARLAQDSASDEQRIRQAYEMLYQRPASAEEVEIGLSFLQELGETPQGLTAWQQYAQILLSANEFMYLK